jgi:hypothetical protein
LGHRSVTYNKETKLIDPLVQAAQSKVQTAHLNQYCWAA